VWITYNLYSDWLTCWKAGVRIPSGAIFSLLHCVSPVLVGRIESFWMFKQVVCRVTTVLWKVKETKKIMVCVAGCSGLLQRHYFKASCCFSRQRPQVSTRSLAVQIFAERVASVAVMILLTLHLLVKWSQTSRRSRGSERRLRISAGSVVTAFTACDSVQYGRGLKSCRRNLLPPSSVTKGKQSKQNLVTEWKVGYGLSKDAVSSSGYIVSNDGLWWIINWKWWAREL
jgi:hypothetical protein